MKVNGEMTLNQAIEHLESLISKNTWSCSECKVQHEQLLVWLKELRSLRTREPIYITEEKFRSYQRVQRAGESNMFEAIIPNISRTEHMFIIKHYDELIKKFGHLEDIEEEYE